MDDHSLAKAVAHLLTRLIVDLPLSLLIIRIWVRWALFETFNLPSPSWRQTFGIALLFLTISP